MNKRKTPPRCDARKVENGVTLVCRRALGHGRPGTFGVAGAKNHAFALPPAEEEAVLAVLEVRAAIGELASKGAVRRHVDRTGSPVYVVRDRVSPRG